MCYNTKSLLLSQYNVISENNKFLLNYNWKNLNKTRLHIKREEKPYSPQTLF